MHTFLEELAATLYNEHAADMAALTIVLPNQRAGLFFRQFLAQHIEQPIWSPKIMSIEEFIGSMSTLEPADELSLIFELFDVYKTVVAPGQTFDNYYYWGQLLLADFDEIDKHLVEAQHLYTNLARLKALDDRFEYLTEAQRELIKSFWQSFGDDPSKEQASFVQQWERFAEVYNVFRERLSKRNMAYAGMIYREVAQQSRQPAFSPPYGQVVFAGLNALAPAEEAIVKWFVTERQAPVYWDTDAYYIDNKEQEAGYYLRRYRQDTLLGRTFPATLPQRLATTPPQVTVTGVPLQVGQAKIMGQQLTELMETLGNDFDPNRTVVVLPEEHLLFPVMHSLPPALDKVNVTMGYPLRNTAVYSLLEHILEMQQQQKGGKNEEATAYFYRPVLAILRHPYVYHAMPETAGALIRNIEERNKIYLSPETLGSANPEHHRILAILFAPLQNHSQLFDYLLGVLRAIYQYMPASTAGAPNIERQYTYQFYTQLNRLREIISQQQVQLKLASLLKLFRQIIQGQRIPFTGEPLEGLQVMGVLETRNLDFDNVFILSMNEGAFPNSSPKGSFIPYSLRMAYELPAFEQQDALYAYSFLRLLQRAKRAYLYYNTEAEGGQAGEQSRFLLQLRYEWGQPLTQHLLSNPITVKPAQAISIAKTPEVLAAMARYTVADHIVASGQEANGQKRLTPSALNMYLDCRLKFYFRYVATVYEPDAVQEDVDDAVFGNLLHYTMEYVYWLYGQAHYPGNTGHIPISPSAFEALKALLPQAISMAFHTQYTYPSPVQEEEEADTEEKKERGPKELQQLPLFAYEGRNIIVQRVILQFASRILEEDARNAPFEILGLEANEQEGYRLNLPLKSLSGGHVGIKGIIDRIDQQGHVVRVLDYKTGKDEKEIKGGIAAFFDRSLDKRPKAGLQTFLYGLLYHEKRTNDVAQGKAAASEVEILAGLYNAKSLFSTPAGKAFDVRLSFKGEGKGAKAEPINDISAMLPEYRQQLTTLLEEIWHPNQPFDQTEKREKCQICPYATICHRNT